MKNHFKITVLFLLLLTFFSCKKDETNSGADPSSQNSMSEFYNANKKPSQNFTLNINTGGSIVTTGGIEFYFPANCLVNSSGVPVTGTADIEIDEVITKADLIFNGISTHSDGRPLKSGGAYRIKVTQGNEVLFMAAGQQYHVWFSSQSSSNIMETYYGHPSTDQYGSINWKTTPAGFTQNVFTHTTDSENIYEILTDKFDWINCDYPYDSLYGELKITLPNGYEQGDIMVMDNSELTGVHVWAHSSLAKWMFAPLNRSRTTVMIRKVNGEYKISAQAFIFTGQQITLPPPVVISEADLQTMINTFQ